MALRTILLLLGVVELLAPKQIVDFWMDVATESGSDVELRPWVYTAARVEGVAFVVWALRRGKKES
ncbi:hypothetical protein SAMN04488063_2520 [Halopelagius inordinatus]|uniref:Uncharacterized protein n=1 Tax=Halopelagius inordinatus TaxID=553467 RepID=A0A1I2T2M1_9EURY|nr:hypothetical protein [Halopelagius inordinatus]SFG59223.1 hypothetical protein SAMN04488063_2520 [Halopelagius inordinatus]